MHHHFFVSYSFIVFMSSSKQLVSLVSESGIIFYVFLSPFGGRKKKKALLICGSADTFVYLLPFPSFPPPCTAMLGHSTGWGEGDTLGEQEIQIFEQVIFELFHLPL